MAHRVAQFVYLKPEYIEEYKKCHAAVWPEVLQQIKECNITDCAFYTYHLVRSALMNSTG